MAKFGQSWPRSAQIGPKSAQIGPRLAPIGQCWPTLGRVSAPKATVRERAPQLLGNCGGRRDRRGSLSGTHSEQVFRSFCLINLFLYMAPICCNLYVAGNFLRATSKNVRIIRGGKRTKHRRTWETKSRIPRATTKLSSKFPRSPHVKLFDVLVFPHDVSARLSRNPAISRGIPVARGVFEGHPERNHDSEIPLKCRGNRGGTTAKSDRKF